MLHVIFPSGCAGKGCLATPRRIEQKLAAALTGILEQDIHDHEVLLDLAPSKSWEMEGWIWYASPPVGFERVVPWSQALGLFPGDLKRYEDARHHIRLFMSALGWECLQRLSRDRVHAILKEIAISRR